MSDERADAVALANKLLDKPNCDPDDDLRMLSRQLLRREERVAQLERLLKSVQTDAGNWLHSDLLDAIDKAVGESGAYRPLDDSGVYTPLEAAFAKEPERSIIDAALRSIGKP